MPEPIDWTLDEKNLSFVSEEFHRLLLSDDRIKFLFENVDMASLRRKQVWFFKSLALEASEGTHSYMTRVHSALVDKHGLDEQHFAALLECLTKALQASELNAKAADKILANAEKLKDHVLGNALPE